MTRSERLTLEELADEALVFHQAGDNFSDPSKPPGKMGPERKKRIAKAVQKKTLRLGRGFRAALRTLHVYEPPACDPQGDELPRGKR